MDRIYTEHEVQDVAMALLANITPTPTTASILAFSGGLGAGKTTLTKAIARVLGVEEEITSPTFVVAKVYPTKHNIFTTLVHIDAYRIESEQELAPLMLNTYLDNPAALVVVEWPEMIKQTLHQYRATRWYKLTHKDDTTRHIASYYEN